MNRHRTVLLTLLGVGLLSVGCSKIHIQSGGEDSESRQELAESRAKDIRSTWADQLRRAQPKDKLRMTKTLIDSVSAGYLRYGDQVADEWQKGNDGRGAPIPDSEMRQNVANWNKSQQAVFSAYEETLDYAIQSIRDTRSFDAATLSVLDDCRGQFDKVYSAVFYPSGTVSTYRSRLSETHGDTERLSEALQREIDRY